MTWPKGKPGKYTGKKVSEDADGATPGPDDSGSDNSGSDNSGSDNSGSNDSEDDTDNTDAEEDANDLEE
jgi:cation:H+ antiporter